jgi:hypothetical protein
MKDGRKETAACQKATQAYPEMMEVNPEEMESVVLHAEVCKEKAAMETVRALKKRHGDRHLALMR